MFNTQKRIYFHHMYETFCWYKDVDDSHTKCYHWNERITEKKKRLILEAEYPS